MEPKPMTGHEKLVADLQDLLQQAERDFAFHDFKTEAATPKVNLVAILDSIRQRVINGEYDNAPGEEV